MGMKTEGKVWRARGLYQTSMSNGRFSERRRCSLSNSRSSEPAEARRRSAVASTREEEEPGVGIGSSRDANEPAFNFDEFWLSGVAGEKRKKEG
jgi:hypothetical protein